MRRAYSFDGRRVLARRHRAHVDGLALAEHVWVLAAHCLPIVHELEGHRSGTTEGVLFSEPAESLAVGRSVVLYSDRNRIPHSSSSREFDDERRSHNGVGRVESELFVRLQFLQ